MALFNYRFVTATQRVAEQGTTSPIKVWDVVVVDGKKNPISAESLVEYSNKLGQDAWELVSDSVNGTSRELVFRHTAV